MTNDATAPTTLEAYVTDHGIRLAVVDGLDYTTDDQGWEHYAGKVRLTMGRRQMTAPWMQGTAHGTAAPRTVDVLEALASDAAAYENARDFADFAAEFGYDEDSRKAEATYHACGTISHKLRRFLAEDYETVLWELER